MPPWVAKERIGTLLLASEMPVPIPRSRTVSAIPIRHFIQYGIARYGQRWYRFPSLVNSVAARWRERPNESSRAEYAAGCGWWKGGLRTHPRANTGALVESKSAQPTRAVSQCGKGDFTFTVKPGPL